MNTTAIDTLKATPVFTVIGTTLAGWNLSDWAYVVTIVYTLLLIVQMVYRWVTKGLGAPDAT